MGHAGQLDVVHIAAAALDQPRILEARYALTDCEFTHREIPFLRASRQPLVPAKAGTQGSLQCRIVALDSRLRGNERSVDRALRSYFSDRNFSATRGAK